MDTSRTRRNPHQSAGHRLPISPHYALKEFGHKLTTFEHKEIMEYPEVWFLGLDAKKVEGTIGAAHNAGNLGNSCALPTAVLTIVVLVNHSLTFLRV